MIQELSGDIKLIWYLLVIYVLSVIGLKLCIIGARELVKMDDFSETQMDIAATVIPSIPIINTIFTVWFLYLMIERIIINIPVFILKARMKYARKRGNKFKIGRKIINSINDYNQTQIKTEK